MSHADNAHRLIAFAWTLVFFTGCARKPVEHTAMKVPAETPMEKPAEPQQPGGLAKTRADFERELAAGLDRLEEEIRELKAKATTLQAETRAKLETAVAELDAKQKAARARLDELGKSSAEAWQHLEHGTVAAWEELEQAVKAAVKEF